MKTLIASVYNDESLKWLETQSNFIKKNTSSEFDHIIFYIKKNNENEKLLKTKKHILLNCNCNFTPQEEHLFGIKKILDTFRSSDFYSHCLVLDSDAFPIKKEWDTHMNRLMKSNSCFASCPIRFENLDTFFHPCVIFFDKNASSLDVSLAPAENLLSYKFEEVIVSPKCKTFPLLKTNFLNIHPIISSVYFDTFYHHGCGSRNFFCRAVHINKYYPDCPMEFITEEFFQNPELFIKKIMGKKFYD